MRRRIQLHNMLIYTFRDGLGRQEHQYRLGNDLIFLMNHGIWMPLAQCMWFNVGLKLFESILDDQ
jgi:hypothetical protein